MKNSKMSEFRSDLEQGNRLYHQAQDRMALLPNYYRWIYRKYAPFLKGDVLELGAGTGLFFRNYLANVESVCAVDYNHRILSKLQLNADPDKVFPLYCDLKGDWSELKNRTFDCVVALDILEHFENDHEFLMKVNRVLRKGGRFLVKVPAQSKLYSGIDEASGHYRRYDSDNLTHRVCSAGFHEIFKKYMNPLGAMVYKVKRKPRTNFSRTFDPGTLKKINLVLPLMAFLDGLTSLKGLSLIGVYEKI